MGFLERRFEDEGSKEVESEASDENGGNRVLPDFARDFLDSEGFEQLLSVPTKLELEFREC